MPAGKLRVGFKGGVRKLSNLHHSEGDRGGGEFLRPLRVNSIVTEKAIDWANVWLIEARLPCLVPMPS
jgi:hypothetical protein